MKRTVTLKIINSILFASYFAIVYFFNLYQVWFSVSLYFISCSCFFKSIFFKRDSSLYLGVLLLGFGLIGMIKYFFDYPLNVIFPFYFGVIGLSSLSVFVFFRQNIHLKVFAISIIEMILLIMFKNSLLRNVEFIGLQILFGLFVLTNLLKRLQRNTRS